MAGLVELGTVGLFDVTLGHDGAAPSRTEIRDVEILDVGLGTAHRTARRRRTSAGPT